ncbi:MAG: RagB/SusD family nutrient uptake outer membrane protein [Sphingobacteriales bacterium]|nr:RagB/SusD family nutrient uptake outer membrane protein [Sphingobacteriales bacterium]OJY91920.1 MAG: hypothetical protein BGP14_23650 [Sphingobacteriales bacterium 44-15]
MKRIHIYMPVLVLTLALPLSFTSCKKVLDVQPENILQDETVFSDESAVNIYLATLYYDLPIEDFTYIVQNGFDKSGTCFLEQLDGEAILNIADDKNSIGDGTWVSWWNYTVVRNVNHFMDQIEKSSFSEQQKNEWMGEAKYIRAHYYFGMVKRYGGIPIVKEVQNYTGDNLEELQIPRNTEKEVYDFIASDLDEAISLLPETSIKEKVNKYTAYALKSRAMLFAGSIARYGNVNLNGVVGIPAADADHYFQLSYDAAKAIIDSHKYSLYNKEADKELNFTNLFLDPDNPELIFVKSYHFPEKGHSWDYRNLPFGQRSPEGSGGRINPTLELVETYDYKDGSQGKLKLTDGSGNPIKYANPLDLFRDKDPRLGASIIVPFADWRGTAVDVRAGIIDGANTVTSGSFDDEYKGMKVIGSSGIGGSNEVSQTGFYVRKYMNPSYDPATIDTWTSSTQYIEFRLGEILLNYAEAAFELGENPDAAWALNQLRSRAGVASLSDGDITAGKVRNERTVEMAFERQHYWDIRRWRIADGLMNNTQFTALMPYYDMQANAYIFKIAKVGYARTFLPQLYYERIDPAEIAKDSKLIQNPNY